MIIFQWRSSAIVKTVGVMHSRKEEGLRRTYSKRNVDLSSKAGRKKHIEWKGCYLL